MGALLAVYHVLLRPWHRTWGATEEEVARQLPGDDVVPEPSDETTRAVTVAAPSGDVWLGTRGGVTRMSEKKAQSQRS